MLTVDLRVSYGQYWVTGIHTIVTLFAQMMLTL